MKPEPILDLVSIDQRPSRFFLLLLSSVFAIYMSFVSLLLASVFIFAATLSLAAIRKCRYKIRYIDSRKTIIKLYANENKECIDLRQNGVLELCTSFRHGKYTVCATSSTGNLELLNTYSYDQAISLVRKLEAATNIKPIIGPHLFKLDPAEKIINKIHAFESNSAKAPKEQTNKSEPKHFPPSSIPDSTPQGRVMNAKEIAIAKITIAWAALFVVVGCYGLATGQYYIPSKNSGIITGGDAYPLSALTMFLGAAVLAPAALSLFGVKLENYKKNFLIIQYSLVAAIIYFAFRKFL